MGMVNARRNRMGLPGLSPNAAALKNLPDGGSSSDEDESEDEETNAKALAMGGLEALR